MPIVNAWTDPNSLDLLTNQTLTQTVWENMVGDLLYLAGSTGVLNLPRKLASTVLGASAASFDFGSIASNYAHLLIVAYLRCDNAGATNVIGIRANNDAGNNYNSEYDYAQQATVSAAENLTVSYVGLGNAPGNSATANFFSSHLILIPNYSAAVGTKTMNALAATPWGTATNSFQTLLSGGFWNNSAAINRLTLIPASGGNFVTNSGVWLYGLPS
jgi:hypothetical protein